MFTHNRNFEVDKDEFHNGLEKILDRAIQYNILSHKQCRLENRELAMHFANKRDSYLDSYYCMTNIQVDYHDLPKEEE